MCLAGVSPRGWRGDRLGHAGPVEQLPIGLRHDAAPAVQVADPFHVVKLANQALDECRRRVQNKTLGQRGRKTDPRYRCRRCLVMARERLSVDGHEKLMGLLAAGDPREEVRLAWNAKEVVGQIYDHTNEPLAVAWVDEIVRDFADSRCQPRCVASDASPRRFCC